MSVEQKIKELLARTGAPQIDEAMDASTVKKDTSIKTANAGDVAGKPRQGGSQDADYEEREETDDNPGAKVSAGIKPNTLKGNGPGNAPNYKTVGDASAVVNMRASSGNVAREELDLEDDENQIDEIAKYRGPQYKGKLYRQPGLTKASDTWMNMDNDAAKYPKGKLKKVQDQEDPLELKPPGTVIRRAAIRARQAAASNMAREDVDYNDEDQIDMSAELNSIFGEDLSEDFRTKATSIFEAAVIARVNTEMDAIAEHLQQEKDQEVEELAEQLVEKVDSFLNYVVEQWLEENTLAVDKGLRSEIAEDFIGGLKTLFQEHYIDVPEEKYDVIDELQIKAGELEDKLNSTLEENMSLTKEVTELKKGLILGEMTGDLADTESEKLARLLEGVSFDSEELFREKLKVIKENYFPKTQKTSPEEQILTEEAPMQDKSDVMAYYAQALSRAVKAR